MPYNEIYGIRWPSSQYYSNNAFLHSLAIDLESKCIICLWADKLYFISQLRFSLRTECNSVVPFVFGQSATQSYHCLWTECNSIVSLSSDSVQLSRVIVFGQSATQSCLCLRKEYNSVVSLSLERVQISRAIVFGQSATERNIERSTATRGRTSVIALKNELLFPVLIRVSFLSFSFECFGILLSWLCYYLHFELYIQSILVGVKWCCLCYLAQFFVWDSVSLIQDVLRRMVFAKIFRLHSLKDTFKYRT